MNKADQGQHWEHLGTWTDPTPSNLNPPMLVYFTKDITLINVPCRWNVAPLLARHAIFCSSTASCSEKLPLVVRLFSTSRCPPLVRLATVFEALGPWMCVCVCACCVYGPTVLG